MSRGCNMVEFSRAICAVFVGFVLVGGMATVSVAQEAEDKTEDESRSLESHFADYLHFAVMGRFDAADSEAKALLQHPDLDPLSDEGAEQLVQLSEKYENSMDILLLLIDNSTIGKNAKAVFDLIRESHRRERMKPARIKRHIELLAGEPNQRVFAMEQLQASGEYAIPWMLKTLTDDSKEDLHPFVVAALPKLGKKAVNPLIAALGIEDEDIRFFVIEALGKIGYPQVTPYLKRVAADKDEDDAMRTAATEAIGAIVAGNPDVQDTPADALFARQAEQYFKEVESLQADPREDRANVWFLRTGGEPRDEPIVPVEVPREIYTLVKCMQECEASLKLNAEQPDVLALWLTANFRREARLRLNVESEEPVDGLDPTRGEKFPRSIYFARSAGPRHCRIVLNRAVKDLDRDVALGAIAAMNVSAGPAAMVLPEGDNSMSLAEALHFPDLLVRIKAALALGRAMPKEPFKLSEEVVPVLASALSLQGRKCFMVIEPDEKVRETLTELMADEQTTVVAGERLSDALGNAHDTMTHLEGIFLASDVDRPTVIEAVRQIKADPRFGLTPIVVVVKEGDNLVLDRIKAEDDRIGRVLDDTGEDMPGADFVKRLLAKRDQTAPRFGYRPMSEELELELALAAARTLEEIALSQSAVFNVFSAEQALIDTLKHPSEPLRIAAAFVLARLNSDLAQQAIADVALSSEQTEDLRLVAFDALADSARWYGMKLNDQQTEELMQQALGEPNLVLRTAASQALGAMNLATPRAVDILLAQPQR